MFDNVDKIQINEIFSLIEELIEFYKGDDWLVIKKYILRYSRPETRKNFSTRNSKTKKHTLNNFEINLINYCKSCYNINLILYKKDTHECENMNNGK